MNDYDEDILVDLMSEIVDRIYSELYNELIESECLDIGDYTLYIEKEKLL